MVLALAGVAHAAAPPRCDRCNVVLVTFDALRADRLGAYGYPKPTSPALDAFARRSTLFEDCISQSATTVTAVPAILTGRYPVTDALVSGLKLRADVDTIATVLHEAGYRTLAVISHEYAGCQYSGCRGVDVVSDATPAPEPTATTIDRTLRILDADAREPFFLWLHVRAPHGPHDATAEEFAAMYDGGPSPTVFSPEIRTLRFLDGLARLRDRYRAAGEPVEVIALNGRNVEMTPSILRQMGALYDANVRLADEGFGRLVAHLEKRKLLDRSVVVVGADHGEALGEHRIVGHNGLWNAMLHTPLVVHVPGEPGRRVDTPVMNADILPTVAGLVGVSLAQPVRGRSVFEPRGPDDVRLAEHVADYVVQRGRQKLMVTTRSRQEWPPLRQGPDGKMIRPEPIVETAPTIKGLWDLATDPQEKGDLAPAKPELADELLRLGEAVRRQRPAGKPLPPPDDIVERLKALGYIDRNPDEPR